MRDYRSHGKRHDGTEAYMLTQFDRIRVTNEFCLDNHYEGRRGVFLEYTSPRAYAKVSLDGPGKPVLLHPESLSLDPMCAIDGCEFYHLDGVDYCPSHG